MENKNAKPEKETYKHKKTLGKGAFGTATLVECLPSGELAVKKEVDLSELDKEDQRLAKQEAKVLKVVNHPNCIRFRDVYMTHNGKLNIVMNYADGGDLQKLINRQEDLSNQKGSPQLLSEDEILTLFT